jgi:hypothetical protein
MSAENMVYVPERHWERLQKGSPAASLGWWLSGFAVGFIAAVVMGWVK